MKKRYFIIPEGTTKEEAESAEILQVSLESAIDDLNAGDITLVIRLDEKTKEWEIVLAASGNRISDLPLAILTVKSMFLRERMVPVKEYIQGIAEEAENIRAGEANGIFRQN